MTAAAAEHERLLAPLREDPARSAVLTDVDGTLAPIAPSASEAAILPGARSALAALAARYAVVACVSGRRAEDARTLVGLTEVTYLGNHGLERLEPNAPEPRLSPVLEGHEDDAAAFVASLDGDLLAEVAVRVEDKGPIRALHWRGAEDEEAAEDFAADVGARAREAGLALHRGRKVLELRPPVPFDKGTAITELLADSGARHALYAGDDRTDLDGFRALRERVASGALDTAVCVAIASAESPPELSERADIVVRDPHGFVPILEALAR